MPKWLDFLQEPAGVGWNPLFALYSKNLQGTQTFRLRIPLRIFFFGNFAYSLLQHLWDTQYKNIFLFFALIEKFFLHPPVEFLEYRIV